MAEGIISEPIKKTIELINDRNTSQFDREKLCEALGKSMNSDIYSDSLNLKHSYKNMEKTMEIGSHSPGMRHRSNVSFRSHVGQDHAEPSSRRRNWYVNEAGLFETSLQRLIDT